MIAPAILDQFGKPYRASGRQRFTLQKPSRKKPTELEARYDVAQTTDSNSAYWANADALDADAANSLAVRKKIRERARYEVANNAYLSGIVERQAMFEVSSGPTIQIHSNDEAFNTEVETAWQSWADAVDLAGVLRTMVMARVVDGEAFAVISTNKKLDDPVTLSLRTIECDQVTAPSWYGPADDYVDGITLDKYGNPVEYDVLVYHPGASIQGVVREFDTVPAEAMLHLFRPKRPGQHRGVCEIASSLTLMPGLRRFVAATIAAAETAAKIAVLIETQWPSSELPDSIAPGTAEIPFGAMMGLPDGTKASQIAAEHPNAMLGEFLKIMIGQCGSPLSMPRNIAMCDSSDMNFASGQLDSLPYWGSIAVSQSHTQRHVLRKVVKTWFEEAVLAYGWKKEQRTLPPYTFNWIGKPYSNPVDEATANQTNLAGGVSTFPLEYSRRGLDCVTEWRKQAAALGMTLDQFRALLVQSIYGQAAQDAPQTATTADITTSATQATPVPQLDQPLNGAQIIAAKDVLIAVTAGQMAPIAALGLLTALGINLALAKRMVDAANAIPPQTVQTPETPTDPTAAQEPANVTP